MEIPRLWRLNLLRTESLGAHLQRGNFNPTPMATFAERNLPEECVKNDKLAANLENEMINSDVEILKVRNSSEKLKLILVDETPINVTAQKIVYESVE